MRPLRLQLDGFGSYRQVTEADFSDVDFFALTGPTGSGKSTLIDGLCFALYGTVPRWGKENAIAQALAPAANACRVCLIFEAGGKRYAAVRALARDKKGRVHTREARLDLLSGAVAADAPLDELLAAVVSSVAEGPDDVKDRVQQILGLSYDHFTQSVLLPQGQFAEFLHAKAADRQDLLVELLAFGVYAKVGQRARERARLAADRLQAARRELAELGTSASFAAEQARLDALVTALAALEDTAGELLTSLTAVSAQAADAGRQAAEVRTEMGLLASLVIPQGVPGLAKRIAGAGQLLSENAELSAAAESAAGEAELAWEKQPDRSSVEALRASHASRRELASVLERHSATAAAAATAETTCASDLEAASETAAAARTALEAAQNLHAAVHLASELSPGGTCPVCLQVVTAVPARSVPASLDAARTEAERAQAQQKRARAAWDKAVQASAVARSKAADAQQRLDEVAARLAGAPSEESASRTLAEIAAADEAVRRARALVRERRTSLKAAEDARASLSGEERAAWATLRGSRDAVVRLGAPAVDDADLATAWQSLAAWGAAQLAALRVRQGELDAAAAALSQQVTDEKSALGVLLAEHGITGVADLARLTDPARVLAGVAARRAQAESALNAVRRNQVRAAELDQQVAAHQEEDQVASMLGNLLRANSFERWLCGEALDTLMTEASQTLMELSGGQYQLDRDERSELVVIDFQDAAAQRPVHTLSGGETFQASLALALALSRQVVGLSAGMRDLNSMFLDEGFGTLDEDTLEVVASTLEQLAADSDRMVGVITHVPALAERVPVRFVVSKASGSSTIRKERT
jgi:DNA repair protein SbcC/Rad50